MAAVFNLSGCPNNGEISFSFSCFFWAYVEPRYTQLMFATLLRFGREGKENSNVFFWSSSRAYKHPTSSFPSTDQKSGPLLHYSVDRREASRSKKKKRQGKRNKGLVWQRKGLTYPKNN
jgi:hypothetical protein